MELVEARLMVGQIPDSVAKKRIPIFHELFYSARLVSARVAPGSSQVGPGGTWELRGSPELQNGGLRTPDEAILINRAEN